MVFQSIKGAGISCIGWREIYLPDLTVILLNYAFDLAWLLTPEWCLLVQRSSLADFPQWSPAAYPGTQRARLSRTGKLHQVEGLVLVSIQKLRH